MSDSKLSQAADALSVQMQAQAWAADLAIDWNFTATAFNLVDFDKKVTISVVPLSRKWERRSRAGLERTGTMQIGIRKRHGAKAGERAPKEAISAIEIVGETIAEWLLLTDTLLACTGFTARVMGIGQLVIVDDASLGEQRIVVGVLDVDVRINL